MMFPFACGATPLGNDSVPERFRKAMRRMQGEGGYSVEEGSIREAELLSAGVAAGVGSQAIRRAWANSLPHLAEERLEDWEAALDVPNDAARTDGERRERLAVVVGHAGEPGIESISSAMEATAPSAVVATNTQPMVTADAAEDKTTLYAAVALDDVDLDTPKAYRGVASVLPRVLPARNYGRDFDTDLEKMVVSGYDARLNSDYSFLTRDAIAQQTNVARELPTSPARLVTYAPLVRVDAEDLNAIQDAILMGIMDGALVESANGLDSDPGMLRRVFAIEIAPGVTATIDDSFSWLDRMIHTIIHASSTNDIRPGEADDDTPGVGGACRFWYSGTGGTGAYSSSHAGELRWQVNAGTGALEMVNIHATDTWRIRGFVVATPILSQRP